MNMKGKNLTDVGNRIVIPKKVAMKLSEANRAYFRCQFDGNIYDGYNIMSIEDVTHPDYDRPFKDGEKKYLLKAFCNFIDTAVGLPITVVDQQYGRTDDINDFTNDIDGDGEKAQMKHFAIGSEGLAKVARIHGFYNSQDIFVIRRVDWNHRVHRR